MAAITKADLLDRVAGNSGVSKADAERVLDSFFGAVVSAAKSGEEVAWPGFGKFGSSSPRRSYRPQPPDRRNDQDRGVQRLEVLSIVDLEDRAQRQGRRQEEEVTGAPDRSLVRHHRRRWCRTGEAARLSPWPASSPRSVIDAKDPKVVAHFWGDVLGWPVIEDERGLCWTSATGDYTARPLFVFVPFRSRRPSRIAFISTSTRRVSTRPRSSSACCRSARARSTSARVTFRGSCSPTRRAMSSACSAVASTSSDASRRASP